ncbi:MAG: alpha/beta hydrolase [Terracidiphilus sp.]|jgi:pimeloyl-ACP methyl ester carboxylesterase
MKMFRGVNRSFAFAAAAFVVAAMTQTGFAQANATPVGQARFSVIVEGASAGKAPDVILLPGLASSREVFAAEARLLAPSYRLHRIQIAGFAGEPAGPNANGPMLGPVVEELHRYIVENHIEHAAVIAHSMGGLMGLMLADAHPEDVGKLLIVDALPFYGVVISPDATVDSLRPQAKAMHDGLLAMGDEQFAATAKMMAGYMVISPTGQKIVTAGSIASDRRVYANALAEDMGTDMRPRIASIKTPVTVLYPYSATQGDQAKVDTLYKSAYAPMPNVNLQRIDDSMHFIMLDQPEAFHRAVMSFLGAGK